MNEGVEQARSGELEEAESTLRRALQLDPSSAEAWLNLGHVHRRQERTGDAARAFRSGLEVAEGALAHEHRFWLAKTELETVRSSPMSYEQRRSKTRELLGELGTVVEVLPGRAQAWLHVAECHEFLGELNKADAAYRHAIEADPMLSLAFVGLGLMYMDYGYANLAMTVLETNVQVNDQDSEAWYGLGRAHTTLGRHEEAITALDKARALAPDESKILYALGMAHAELRHRRESIDLLERVVAAPDVPEQNRKAANNTIARMQDVL